MRRGGRVRTERDRAQPGLPGDPGVSAAWTAYLAAQDAFDYAVGPDVGLATVELTLAEAWVRAAFAAHRRAEAAR